MDIFQDPDNSQNYVRQKAQIITHTKNEQSTK